MKFGIDLGHGVGQDRGAVGNIAEETIIDAVGPLVINKLKALGHSVIELRPDSATSVQDSLYQRYTKADYYNVDMCVSIHANAGGGVGTEVYTYNAKEVTEARNILNNIVSLGFRNRGIKDGLHLAMVKRPKSTSMLIEICFVDSSDSDLYSNIGPEVIAAEIVEGLTGQVINTTKGEWILDNTGWWFKYSDGTWPTGWAKLPLSNNSSTLGWFYFNNKGYMGTQWIIPDGNWYYLDDDGRARQNEWAYDKNNGKWYYFDDNCVMLQSKWQKINNEWYYFDNSGAMQTGWIKDNGKDYLLYSNGAMAHDVTIYGYKFDSNGVATKI